MIKYFHREACGKMILATLARNLKIITQYGLDTELQNKGTDVELINLNLKNAVDALPPHCSSFRNGYGEIIKEQKHNTLARVQ